MAGGNEIVVKIVSDSPGEMNSSRLTGGNLTEALSSFTKTVNSLNDALNKNTKQFTAATAKKSKVDEQEFNFKKKLKDMDQAGYVSRRDKALSDHKTFLDLDYSYYEKKKKLDAVHREQDRKQGLKNSLLSTSGLSAGFIATFTASLGKQIGQSLATYSNSNALNRPDLAYAQLISSGVNTGTNLLSSLLVGGGALLGSIVPGIGTAFGALLGGGAAGIANLGAFRLLSGYSLQNSAQYFSQLGQTAFGSSYSGFDANGATLLPGGKDNTPFILSSLYGSLGNSSALNAAIGGSNLLATLTGSGQNLPQIVPILSQVLKATGVGQSSQQIGDLLYSLNEAQRTYGGDTVQNLQAIQSLLQNSTLAGNTQAAMRLAYGTQLFNPALTQSGIAFSQAAPTDQYIQSILAKGLTGVDLQQLYYGTPQQQAAQIAKGLALKKGYTPGGPLTSGILRAQFGLGVPLLDAISGSSTNSLGNINSDAQTTAIRKVFAIASAGKIPTASQLNGVLPGQTSNLIQSSTNSESDYNQFIAGLKRINSVLNTITGTSTTASQLSAAQQTSAGLANQFHKLIHEDNS